MAPRRDEAKRSRGSVAGGECEGFSRALTPGSLRYHFIFATHKRKPWIDQELEEFLYPIIRRHFRLNNGAVETIGGIEDHVHIVAGIRPIVAVSDVLKAVKRDSAKAVRRNFKRFRAFKWQEGFGGFTANPNDMRELIDYVENQKEHHHNNTLIEEFEILLDKCMESTEGTEDTDSKDADDADDADDAKAS